MVIGAPTSTSLSLKQAAERVGRDRTTLLRAIKAGDISASKDEGGQWWIEISELNRRYSPAQDEQGQSPVHARALTGGDGHAQPYDIGRELAVRDAQITALAEERERERRQLQDTIDDLRRRLDQETEERRRLTLLLTDQRAKEEAKAEVQAPSPAASLPPKGLLRRLFGG